MSGDVRVELPAGVVEALVVRPGDYLVLRVQPQGLEEFRAALEEFLPAVLAGRVVAVECEGLAVVRAGPGV